MACIPFGIITECYLSEYTLILMYVIFELNNGKKVVIHEKREYPINFNIKVCKSFYVENESLFDL